MRILEVKSVGKFKNLEQIPDDLPQFAFIGRSNVGKSSLINFLVDRKKLAETSKQPGKTRSIDFYYVRVEDNEVEKGWYLVDLPGYGYAKVGKGKRVDRLRKSMEYFINSQNLKNVFLLIDSSIPPQKKDLIFAYELDYQKIPFKVIFTKTDKLTKVKLNRNILQILEALRQEISYIPEYFTVSVKKKKGKDEILKFIFTKI